MASLTVFPKMLEPRRQASTKDDVEHDRDGGRDRNRSRDYEDTAGDAVGLDDSQRVRRLTVPDRLVERTIRLWDAPKSAHRPPPGGFAPLQDDGTPAPSEPTPAEVGDEPARVVGSSFRHMRTMSRLLDRRNIGACRGGCVAAGRSTRLGPLVPSLAAFPRMLETDRRRRGFTVGQAAWRLGIAPDQCRALEAGEPIHDFDTWDRICKLCGWPQRFVGQVRNG